jgi:hypothetical protein
MCCITAIRRSGAIVPAVLANIAVSVSHDEIHGLGILRAVLDQSSAVASAINSCRVTADRLGEDSTTGSRAASGPMVLPVGPGIP